MTLNDSSEGDHRKRTWAPGQAPHPFPPDAAQGDVEGTFALGPEADPEIEDLRAEHREAEHRLAELDRRLWLSPDEQVELARLKKRKLRLKDRMRALGLRVP